MSFYQPIPSEEHIYEVFDDVDVDCPKCGTHDVKRYKVLRSGGWQLVERCRTCFEYVSTEPTNHSYLPLTHGWPTSSAG